MDRIIEYPMEQIVVDDFLNQRVADMIALGKLISALLGSQTMVEGLACTPTSPASMDVLVAPGQIFFLEAVDTTTYGDLSPTADILGHNVAANAETIMKQGLILSQTTFALTAPSTSGDSVNYLISVAYEDQDTEDVVLNYYNSSNPSQPLQGPNNSGTAQPTLRQGKCILTLTAGTAAATGTQQTPAVPSGQTGLYVITVASGQTSITASNIAIYTGAPFLSQKLFNLMNESGTLILNGLIVSDIISANVTGDLTIPNATASNNPVALGQFIGPGSTGGGLGTLAASTTYTKTLTFTAPSDGYVWGQARAIFNSTPSTSSACGLFINGTQLARDNTLLTMTEAGVLQVSAGESVTVEAQLVTSSTAPGVDGALYVDAIFIPSLSNV